MCGPSLPPRAEALTTGAGPASASDRGAQRRPEQRRSASSTSRSNVPAPSPMAYTPTNSRAQAPDCTMQNAMAM